MGERLYRPILISKGPCEYSALIKSKKPAYLAGTLLAIVITRIIINDGLEEVDIVTLARSTYLDERQQGMAITEFCKRAASANLYLYPQVIPFAHLMEEPTKGAVYMKGLKHGMDIAFDDGCVYFLGTGEENPEIWPYVKPKQKDIEAFNEWLNEEEEAVKKLMRKLDPKLVDNAA